MRNERVAIDTNILLYILGGDKSAHELLQGHEVVE
jgi:predicted nucleic acid-binding protein